MTTAASQPVDIRARRRDQTRQDLLASAWGLAERDGIASLSLRELAREAGMRAPSLYTYFDSKGAIFDAMFVAGYRQLDQMYDEIAIDPEKPAATLAAAIRQFLRFCQASTPRYQLMFTRVIAGWEPSPAAYAASVASYDRMAAAFAAIGLEGQRTLDLWTALTAGLAAQQLANDPTGDRWVQLSRDAAEMFLAHIGRKP